MKREDIITLFIHGFPWALSYLLDHLLLVWKCALCGFWKYFLKRRFRLGKLCNGSRFVRTCTKCWTFENISWCLSWKCVFVLKVRKQLRTFLPTQKSFVHFFIPLILLSYHLLASNPIFGYKGTGVGHRIVMNSNVARYLSISLKGLRSFVRRHS